jgi:predicted benzoate:H+ symporter BenE
MARFFFDPASHWSAVLAAGFAFVLAGIHMVSLQHLYDENGRSSALMGGLFLLSFAYLCFIGAFSDRAVWSSMPFVARPISGLFGVLCAAFSLRSFYLVIKPKGKK